MQTRFSFVSFAALSLVGLLSRPLEAQTRYAITDLGHLPGTPTLNNWVTPTAINNNGQIVGVADTDQLDFIGFTIRHAFLWDAVHGMQDLGTFSPDSNAWSNALGINDAGLIIGNTSFSFTNEHFGWMLFNGALTRLNASLPPFQTDAMALNANGQILGAFDNDMQVPGVFGSGYFIWQGGTAKTLPALTTQGNTASYQALNTKGQVAGTAVISSGSEGVPSITTAFLLQDGAYTYLPQDSHAVAINGVGQVLLGSIPPALWTPTVPNGTSGSQISLGNITPLALNDVGQVIGYVSVGPGVQSAAIYDTAQGLQKLDALIPANSGWSLVEADAINAKGQITGIGYLNSQPHAFLLTPGGSGSVPVPLALTDFRLASKTVMGGLAVAGRVFLNQAAPTGGVLVTLASGNKAATAPASVKIAAGATFADFTLSTKIINPLTSVQGDIKAAWNGVTLSKPLTVTPVEVKSLTLNPLRVKGGNSSIGTVTLPFAAPSTGLVVTLHSAIASATVPTSVKVAAGRSTATFTIKTAKVKKSTGILITAKAGTQPLGANLTTSP